MIYDNKNKLLKIVQVRLIDFIFKTNRIYSFKRIKRIKSIGQFRTFNTYLPGEHVKARSSVSGIESDLLVIFPEYIFTAMDAEQAPA